VCVFIMLLCVLFLSRFGFVVSICWARKSPLRKPLASRKGQVEQCAMFVL